MSSPPEKRLKNEQNSRSYRRSEKKLKRTSSIETSNVKSGKTKEKYSGPPSVILDNGGYTAKIGMSTDEAATIIPNCIMKVKSERKRCFIGNQIEECRDLSGLYYLLPFEKGFLLKFNVQKPVWDYIFTNVCPIEDKPVIMTQPPFNFKTIQEITDEIFFEEYEIKSLLRVSPCDLAKYEYINNVIGRNVPCIIVDSGYSFTNIVPYIGGKKYYKGLRRISVGGKVLTNYLKDVLSYRQLHVMDETYVINQVKEDTGFVSQDIKEDMKIAAYNDQQNTIVKNYVLPDFNTIRRGYIQDGEITAEISEGCQILRLNNERFMVPELLFHPSDVGMGTAGIAETIVKCIYRCPAKDQQELAKNIVLIGGNACFLGYRDRVYADVRSYLPDHWDVNVYKPENPITFPWQGGKSLSSDPKIKTLLVTKEQYEERGASYTYERFSDWLHATVIKDEEYSQVEIQPRTSILSKMNFTRFDLFGKHEFESEEKGGKEVSDVDKVIKETNDSNKGDAVNNLDVPKDFMVTDDSQSSHEFASNNHQDDLTSCIKANDKSKSAKMKHQQNSNYESYENFYKSYDFNILGSNYI